MLREIKGNTECVLMVQGEAEKNAIGEKVSAWVDAVTFSGFLSLQSADSGYLNYAAKMEESTHCVLCEYLPDIYAYRNRNTRLKATGRMFDVLYIDNPDERNEHLEIFLRFVGGDENG